MKRLKDLKRKGGKPKETAPEGAPDGEGDELDALFSELEGGEGGDEEQPLADMPGGMGASFSAGSMGGAAGEDVGELKQSIRKIEVAMETVRKEMGKMGDRQNTAEKNIEDLLMIYELVAKQFNPFAAKGTGPEEGGLQEGAMGAATMGGLPETGAPGEIASEGHVGDEEITAGESERPGEPGEILQNGTGAMNGEYPATDEYGRPLLPGYGAEQYDRETMEYDHFGRPIAPGGTGPPEPPPGLPRIEMGGRWKERPVLARIRNDYASVVLALRWVEFLFERVKRNKISALLDYYEDIGWISNEVKSNIMAYARGTVQDISAYDPDLEEDPLGDVDLPDDVHTLDDKGMIAHRKFRKITEWKLSAEDHLKSLLFIKKMSGSRIDKDELNSLEQEIKVMKYSLRRFHEV